jgi:hypothetical protein
MGVPKHSLQEQSLNDELQAQAEVPGTGGCDEDRHWLLRSVQLVPREPTPRSVAYTVGRAAGCHWRWPPAHHPPKVDTASRGSIMRRPRRLATSREIYVGQGKRSTEKATQERSPAFQVGQPAEIERRLILLDGGKKLQLRRPTSPGKGPGRSGAGVQGRAEDGRIGTADGNTFPEWRRA